MFDELLSSTTVIIISRGVEAQPVSVLYRTHTDIMTEISVTELNYYVAIQLLCAIFKFMFFGPILLMTDCRGFRAPVCRWGD